MRPISIAEDEGFIDFDFSYLQMHPTLPNHINKEDCKNLTSCENIQEILSGKTVALTTDGWSSLATEAYSTVTAHFISETLEL